MNPFSQIESIVIVFVLTALFRDITSQIQLLCVKGGDNSNACDSTSKVLVRSLLYGYIHNVGTANACTNYVCPRSLSGEPSDGIEKTSVYKSCSGKPGCSVTVGNFSLPQPCTQWNANFVTMEHICIPDNSILDMREDGTKRGGPRLYLAYFPNTSDPETVNMTCSLTADEFNLRAMEIHIPPYCQRIQSQLTVWYRKSSVTHFTPYYFPNNRQTYLNEQLLSGIESVVIIYIHTRSCGQRSNMWWRLGSAKGNATVSCGTDVNVDLHSLPNYTERRTDSPQTSVSLSTESHTKGTTQNSNDQLNTGAVIAGSVVAGVLLIIIAAVVIIVCYRRGSIRATKTPALNHSSAGTDKQIPPMSSVQRGSSNSRGYVYGDATSLVQNDDNTSNRKSPGFLMADCSIDPHQPSFGQGPVCNLAEEEEVGGYQTVMLTDKNQDSPVDQTEPQHSTNIPLYTPVNKVFHTKPNEEITGSVQAKGSNNFADDPSIRNPDKHVYDHVAADEQQYDHVQ